MKGIGPGNYVWRDQLIGMFISKLDRKHCCFLVELLTITYQSAVYAAQDEESKDSLMQEIWR